MSQKEVKIERKEGMHEKQTWKILAILACWAEEQWFSTEMMRGEREAVKAYSCVCVYKSFYDTQWNQLLTPSTDPDGLNDLSEWQLGGEGVAMVDDRLAHSRHIETWCEGMRKRSEPLNHDLCQLSTQC